MQRASAGSGVLKARLAGASGGPEGFRFQKLAKSPWFLRLMDKILHYPI